MRSVKKSGGKLNQVVKILPVFEKKRVFKKDASFRGHILGIYFPNDVSMKLVKENILNKNIFVSYCGHAIRIAPNIFNTKEDIEKLVSCFI